MAIVVTQVIIITKILHFDVWFKLEDLIIAQRIITDNILFYFKI